MIDLNMRIRILLTFPLLMFIGCEKEMEIEDPIPEKQPSALETLRKQAVAGHAEAQMQLGEILIGGPLEDRNETTGVMWLRLAAEQGLSSAQYALGESFLNGIGVTKDEDEAIKWLALSAEQGKAMAQNVLGWVMANRGDGDDNFTAAVHWFRAAANQGYAVAQANLRTMYRDGKGVRRNKVLAYSWWEIALEYTENIQSFHKRDGPNFNPTGEELKEIEWEKNKIRKTINKKAN